MIRLTKAKAPRSIILGAGVAVTVKPLTFALYRAAMHSAERQARDVAFETGLIEAAGGSIADIPSPHDAEGMRGLRDQFLLQALARHAITAWEGIGDEDGAPAAVTPAAIDALIRDHPLLAERFEVEYLREITAVLAEGNASGAAPTGTSAAAPTTADGAGNSTSPAPAAKADAPADSVLTASTSP